MLDFKLRFCDAQTLTAGDSAKTIDTGEGDLGKSGDNIALEVIIGKPTGTATSDLVVTLVTGDVEALTDGKPAVAITIPKEKVNRGGVAAVNFLGLGLRRYHKLTFSGAAGATGATITAGYALHGGQTNMI